MILADIELAEIPLSEVEEPAALPTLPGDAVLDIRRTKRHRTRLKGGRS